MSAAAGAPLQRCERSSGGAAADHFCVCALKAAEVLNIGGRRSHVPIALFDKTRDFSSRRIRRAAANFYSALAAFFAMRQNARARLWLVVDSLRAFCAR